MKDSSRITSALLILVMLINCVSAISCGNDTGSQFPSVSTDNSTAVPESEAEETEPVDERYAYIDSLDKIDFEGASYKYLTVDGVPLPKDGYNGEAVNDSQYEVNLKIENLYNVKVEYPNIQNPSSAVAINVLAGTEVADVYIGTLANGTEDLGAISTQGVLYNMLELPYLKLDAEWWSPLMYKNLQYRGVMLYTTGDMAQFSYNNPTCLFLNLTVAENYRVNYDAIYEKVYNSSWTYDALSEYTKDVDSDLNGDGKINAADDILGIVNEDNTLAAAGLVTSCGIELCRHDEEGNILIDFDTEKVYDVIAKLSKQFRSVPGGRESYSPAFRNDRALFQVHFLGTANGYRSMESDFVVLPMPKYDEIQETYVSYLNPWCYCFVSVPLVQEDEYKTGLITEVMEYLSYLEVRPAIYEITLKEKAMRNEDSQRMLDIVLNTKYIDFNGIYEFGSIVEYMRAAIFNNASFKSNYEKVKSRAQKKLDTFLEKFVEEHA